MRLCLISYRHATIKRRHGQGWDGWKMNQDERQILRKEGMGHYTDVMMSVLVEDDVI